MIEPEKNKTHNDSQTPQEERSNVSDAPPDWKNETDENRSNSSGPENGVNDSNDAPKNAPNSGNSSEKEEKPVYDVRNSMQKNGKSTTEEPPQPGILYVLLVMLLIGGVAWWFMGGKGRSAPISYGFFLQQLDENNIEKVVINGGNKVSGEFRVEPDAPDDGTSASADEKAPNGTVSPKKSPENTEVGNPAKNTDSALSQTETPRDSSVPTGSKPVKVSTAADAPSAESSTEAVPTAETVPAVGTVPTAEGVPAVENVPVSEKSDSNAQRVGDAIAPSVSHEDAENPESSGNAESAKKDAESAKTAAKDDEKTEKKESLWKNLAAKKAQTKLPKKFTTTLPSPLEAGGELDKKIREKVGDKYNIRESLDAVGYMMMISIVVTVILFVSIWVQFRRTRDQLGGGQMFGFSKSPAKRFQGGEDSVSFKDVAGLKSVKEDLSEIVDFLKNPEKFERLGARIPKGVLMCGPPGTGKTLLARAIAGEAGVAFYSINASEFIQMFVGVGASRVRDMFEVARSNAPAILFIDEIDAIGRLRGTGIGGGNDEREQTLNQILSEMDGFATTDVVIVIAATNRPDVLDPALLRPGRFDRRVTVDRPVHKDRIQLFNVHTKKVPLNKDVNFERLAAMTTGLTGADIRNIVNEAALWACRYNRDNVSMSDFYYAIDKVLMGAKREEVISDEEKEKTSYHEAGHSLVAWLTPECDRVSKVSVIPRGQALGVTWSIPEEDRLMHSQNEIYAKLKMMLGGREAEKLVFNELNAGAANDLERATELVQKMVASWGMSPRIGPAAFHTGDEHPFLGKEMSTQRNFSEKTAQIIDEEIMRILNDASQQVETLLGEHRNMLDALAQALVIREELDEAQIEEILGPPAYRKTKNDE